MNPELTQKLLNRFSILYRDYDSPMTQTCMSWRLDHGDGWFEIIWQLTAHRGRTRILMARAVSFISAAPAIPTVEES